MNCLTARQALELMRGEGARTDEPADDNSASALFTPDRFNRMLVEEASRHVEGCPTCQTAVRRREELDDKLGSMIRDVAVPGDLKARLLARLEGAAPQTIPGGERVDAPRASSSAAVRTSGSPAVTTAANRAAPLLARPRVGSRRRWLGRISLAAAVCAFAGVGVYSWWPRPLTLSLEQVRDLLARDDIRADHLAEFTQFAGGLTPQVPATMLTRPLELPARRLGNLDVAVYFFTLPGPRKTPLEGRLAVIPRRRVAPRELPPATSFLGGPTVYTRGGYCITAWMEGDFVYVCCLKGDEDKLHRLLPKQNIL